MSSSISSIGSNNAMMQAMRMRRPDPTQMADKLFSKLDSSGQGYLTKADLQSAMDSVSSASTTASTSSASGSTSSVDDLFSQLDTNGDGKVTKQEFTDTLKKVAEQFDSQAMQANGGMQGSNMGGGMSGMGGMPPPPPPPQDGSSNSGFTKDELTNQLSQIGSSDSQRSSTISDIVNNFDKADTNGDGKVSFKEAMTFEQSQSNSSSSASSSSSATASSTSTDSSTTTASTASNNLDSQVLAQIMKLMQAYSAGNDQSSSLLSTLSVMA